MDSTQHEKTLSLSQDRKAILQRFVTLGELTANTSHELKNLLISIHGYCELMEEKLKNNDPIDQDIKEIKQTSELAKKIFMELLSFSRGMAQEEKQKYSFNDLVEEVFQILRTAQKITFEKELVNQRGEVVQTGTTTVLLARRP